MAAPEITVLLSVHNGMPFLPAAVDSILRQDFAEFEFLIVDDASTDESVGYLQALRDPRVRLLRLEENIGLTAALNRGLREARSTFIARHDADDLAAPQRLRLQREHLRQNPRCVAVGAQAALIDGAGRSLGKKPFPLEHDAICFAHLFDNALAHAAVMFRREEVAAAGNYDERWRASQDYELWSRLSTSHALANLPQQLVTLRVLASSITRSVPQADLIRQVQAAHFSRVFRREATPAELDLIGSVRSHVPLDRLADFQALFAQSVEEYAAQRPAVKSLPDFRRTVAQLHERVGYNLLTTSRLSAWGELRRAWQAWPPSVLAMPWIRILALTLLGDGARRLYGKVAGGGK
jgi:glycosyltransferase involved in cell wall biosynthesis